MNKVEVLNISKTIGAKNILSNVSFTCCEGETLGIIGSAVCCLLVMIHGMILNSFQIK